MDDEHCVDCCCARSWNALGITSFTGKSIPEHIIELKTELAEADKKVAKLEGWLKLLYYHHCDDIETDKTLQEISGYIKAMPKD